MAGTFSYLADGTIGIPGHEPPYPDSLIVEYLTVTTDGTATLYAADQTTQDDRLKQIGTIISVQGTRGDSTAGTAGAAIAAGGKSVLLTTTTSVAYHIMVVGYAQ